MFFFSLLGTLAGWNCCCGASEIAQTAHTVCFMVVFTDRLDVWINDGCMARETDDLIDGCGQSFHAYNMTLNCSNVLHSCSPHPLCL